MNPSQIFIFRPIATSLLMVALTLAGVVAYGLLPLSALPNVDYPTIQVQTFFPGASPEVMTSAVTAPLERQLGQMPGLGQMTSTSSAGASVITLQFSEKLGLDIAEQEVQAAIDAASNLLPSGLPTPPIYAKFNPGDAPIMTIAVTSQTRPLTELANLAETRLVQKISQVPGVGLVGVSGAQRPAMRIQFDPRTLAGYRLHIDDLRTTIANANVNTPKGSFDGPMRASTINANDQLTDLEEFRNLVIAYRDGRPVRLLDVAQVVLGPENDKLAAWADRTRAIILNIQRQPGANVIAVVEAIRSLLPTLEAGLPSAIDVRILSDRTTTIRASLAEVEFELALAVALVILVIFLFLRNLPATIIPGLSVPLSIVGAFAAMYLLGFSLDNLSLMALTISTGFVVDDAIVVIENINRHVESGERPLRAALRGSREIGFTIVSLTLSLIAALIPLLFMDGVVGRLFHEFAVTLAVTIALSAIVSLTLVPMLCARLLRRRSAGLRHRLDREAERVFAAMLATYSRALEIVLQRQPLALSATLLTLAATIAAYAATPKGFFPVQDTGLIEAVSVASPTVSHAAMALLQTRLADAILRDPAVASVSSFIGVDGANMTPNTGRFLIDLAPPSQRRVGAGEVIRRLQAEVAQFPGVSLNMQPVQELTIDAAEGGRARYHFILQSANPDELAVWTPRLLQRLEQAPELTGVASDAQQQGLAVDLVIDRATASRYGVTPATIDNMLYDAFGQRIISTIYTQAAQYRVILEIDPALSRTLEVLSSLYLPSSVSTSNGQTPLSALVRVDQRRSPLAIHHLGQLPAATIFFDAAQGSSLGAAIEAIERAEQDIGLPASFVTNFQGAAGAFRTSTTKEILLIFAAVVTIYIVLGVLYESFIHPITILSTLPSAGLGALLALAATGGELDLIAVIGLVLLIGIVKKNAIMVVDFAVEARRSRGLSAEEAIFEACLLRFRPILMTTMAAILGALPLLIDTGVGFELRRPLGVAIVGGLLLSQAMTLFTTPVIYLYLDRLEARLSTRRSRAAIAVDEISG
jgi:multidrug efflux pump